MQHEILQALLDKLEEIYENLDDECGGYSRTDHGYEWLSVKRIVDLIHEVDEEYY